MAFSSSAYAHSFWAEIPASSFPFDNQSQRRFEMYFIALYIALLHLCVCVVGWGYPIRLVT